MDAKTNSRAWWHTAKPTEGLRLGVPSTNSVQARKKKKEKNFKWKQSAHTGPSLGTAAAASIRKAGDARERDWKVKSAARCLQNMKISKLTVITAAQLQASWHLEGTASDLAS